MHKILLNQNEITPSNVNALDARRYKLEYLWDPICKWHNVIARKMTKYAIQRRGQIELLHLGPCKSFEAQVRSLEPEGMRDAVLE